MSIKKTQNKRDGNVCIDIKISEIKMECLNCYEEKLKNDFYNDFIPICKKHNICKDCVLRYKNLKEIKNQCYCFYCYPLGFQTKSFSPRVIPENSIIVTTPLTCYEKIIIRFKICINCLLCETEFTNYQNERQEFDEEVLKWRFGITCLILTIPFYYIGICFYNLYIFLAYQTDLIDKEYDYFKSHDDSAEALGTCILGWIYFLGNLCLCGLFCSYIISLK